MNKAWLPQFQKKDFSIRDEETLYSGYSKLKTYTFEIAGFKGGSHIITREVLLRRCAVAVLLIDVEQQQLVLVEQFRVGALKENVSPWLLEVVAGVIDEGEDPETAAKRETREETGYIIDSLMPICHYLVSPGISDEKIFIYVAKISISKDKEFSNNSHLRGILLGASGASVVSEGTEDEDIKTHCISITEAFDLLNAQAILSSPTLIALQWLKLNIRNFLNEENLKKN